MHKSLTLLFALLATPAFAHAHLQKSTPAANSKVASPQHIVLHFSEALEPAFSGALLLDQDGRNVSGAPVVARPPRRVSRPARCMSRTVKISCSRTIRPTAFRSFSVLHVAVRSGVGILSTTR